jgi:hypothetical protein
MRSHVGICLDDMADWSNDTEIRRFDFDSRPAWEYVDNGRAGDYAWKLQMVEDVVRDYGGLVFWQDSGNELRAPLRSVWNDIAVSGIWSSRTGGDMEE